MYVCIHVYIYLYTHISSSLSAIPPPCLDSVFIGGCISSNRRICRSSSSRNSFCSSSTCQPCLSHQNIVAPGQGSWGHLGSKQTSWLQVNALDTHLGSKLKVLRAILAPSSGHLGSKLEGLGLLTRSWKALGGSGLQEPNIGPTGRRMDTLRPPSWTPSWTHLEDCNPPKTQIFFWFW